MVDWNKLKSDVMTDEEKAMLKEREKFAAEAADDTAVAHRVQEAMREFDHAFGQVAQHFPQHANYISLVSSFGNWNMRGLDVGPKSVRMQRGAKGRITYTNGDGHESELIFTASGRVWLEHDGEKKEIKLPAFIENVIGSLLKEFQRA